MPSSATWGSIQVTGKRLGVDKSYDERCDATARATNRSYCIRLWPLRTCVPLVVLISLMKDADAQSVLAYGVDVQKYRAVLAQEGFNLIIARSCTELPLPYDAITSFPGIDTKQILPGSTYEQVQYLAMG